MKSSNKGLTVGELTIAIGAVLIASLIWSSLQDKEQSKTSLLNSQDVNYCIGNYLS